MCTLDLPPFLVWVMQDLLRAIRDLEADSTLKSQRALEKALHLRVMAILLCNPDKGNATITVARSTPLQKIISVVDWL